MKIITLITCICISSVACKAQSTKKPSGMETNQKAGFTKIFDGSTTTGWHTYGKTEAGAAWKVEDGSLYLDTAAKKMDKSAGGDLVTNEVYENFHLKLDWKIAKNGNSGIIFFINEDPSKYGATYNTGLEMQVLDNDGHPDAKINKHRAGDLYDLIASKSEPVKPAGEWNKVEIISNNGNLKFMLNGTEVVNTTLWDSNWKTMVAGSKFKTMPGFGIFKEGKIALQDHGDQVWYKNIEIKRL